jgi:hypothetical protein
MQIQYLKPILIHLVKIVLIETVYCVAAFYGYALFSFMFFGEGDKSFAYTKQNGYIYWCVIIIPPTLFNLICLFVNFYKGELGNFYADLLVQIFLFIFSLTVYKICTNV